MQKDLSMHAHASYFILTFRCTTITHQLITMRFSKLVEVIGGAHMSPPLLALNFTCLGFQAHSGQKHFVILLGIYSNSNSNNVPPFRFRQYRFKPDEAHKYSCTDRRLRVCGRHGDPSDRQRNDARQAILNTKI
jgi:hypothetical protein